MTRKVLLIIILYVVTVAANAQNITPTTIHWHSEATDTVKITDLLSKAAAIKGRSVQDRVGAIARMFVDTPYKSATLEIVPEGLVINLDEMDCTTFVENVAALAITVGEGRSAWQDFLHNLTSLRYRAGAVTGYASRLHYISDWIIDNSHRGNMREVTGDFPGVAYQIKSLDFMTSNRDKYPALADDETFNRIKNTEIGYRNHRFPYIKSGAIGSNRVTQMLRDGDIVALVCRTPGLDVSHLGIITIADDGAPHLLHASLKEGKVVIDSLPLTEYLKKNRNLIGMRVIRLADR